MSRNKRPAAEVVMRRADGQDLNGPPSTAADSPSKDRFDVLGSKVQQSYGHRVILQLIVARWPRAFCNPPKPLKVGIFRDICLLVNVAPEIKEPWRRALFQEGFQRRLSEAIEAWSRDHAYLTACTEGAIRIDLAGKPAGVVSAREAAYARCLADCLCQNK